MDRDQARQRISLLAATACRAMGLELWGMDYAPGPGGKKGILRIYIDSSQGVSVDQCAEISRQLSVALDVENIVPGSYTLEVSSPGLDRVFFTPDQLKAFTDHEIKITLKEPRDGRKNYSGILKEISDDDQLVVQGPQEAGWTFSWGEIKKARLCPSL